MPVCGHYKFFRWVRLGGPTGFLASPRSQLSAPKVVPWVKPCALKKVNTKGSSILATHGTLPHIPPPKKLTCEDSSCRERLLKTINSLSQNIPLKTLPDIKYKAAERIGRTGRNIRQRSGFKKKKKTLAAATKENVLPLFINFSGVNAPSRFSVW